MSNYDFSRDLIVLPAVSTVNDGIMDPYGNENTASVPLVSDAVCPLIFFNIFWSCITLQKFQGHNFTLHLHADLQKPHSFKSVFVFFVSLGTTGETCPWLRAIQNNFKSRGCWILWISDLKRFLSSRPFIPKVGNGGHRRDKLSCSTWLNFVQLRSTSVQPIIFSSQLFSYRMLSTLNVDLVFQDAAKATPLIAGRYYGLCVDMDGPVLFSLRSNCTFCFEYALNIKVTLCPVCPENCKLYQSCMVVNLEVANQIEQIEHIVRCIIAVQCLSVWRYVEIVRCQHWALEILVYWSMSPVWKSSILRADFAVKSMGNLLNIAELERISLHLGFFRKVSRGKRDPSWPIMTHLLNSSQF